MDVMNVTNQFAPSDPLPIVKTKKWGVFGA